ncbi:4-aminobutyrate--2-oxoglutarate transaminase [Hyphococcus sp.]|uniref:4-aminobutyrate--2-oxoglutarate transaminase n=1 Tax=Hyphococcus sp. TaxID=2038636 RepID=UPI003CCC1DA3
MSAAKIKTMDGHSNADWQMRKNAAMARGEGNVAPVFVDRASGSELWDVEGRRYIDFGTGIAVCNTGHRHPKVMKAVSDQLERFSHTCVMVTPYDSAVILAEALNDLAPGPSPKKTMFVTTGAEAVENAIKIARSHTGRRGVIAFDGGYHGRTIMTLGLTGKISPYKNRFGPFPGDIWRAPFPALYHDITVEDALGAVDMLFKTDVDPADCAAMIVEPVQGEGGFYPAPDEFMRGLRERCDRYGIVLIADEIQSGFARTGKFFACEHSGVEPDLMTVAKGLAGGFPLAAVVGKKEIMDAPAPGGLGGTYAGSPVGCAAALAVIDVIREENLTARAAHIGNVFKDRLTALQKAHPHTIGDIRADRGAMIAIELLQYGDRRKPNAALAKAVLTECYAKGLVVLTCGMDGNVFRFLPALTISNDLLDEGISIFEQAFKSCA